MADISYKINLLKVWNRPCFKFSNGNLAGATVSLYGDSIQFFLASQVLYTKTNVLDVYIPLIWREAQTSYNSANEYTPVAVAVNAMYPNFVGHFLIKKFSGCEIPDRIEVSYSDPIKDSQIYYFYADDGEVVNAIIGYGVLVYSKSMKKLLVYVRANDSAYPPVKLTPIFNNKNLVPLTLDPPGGNYTNMKLLAVKLGGPVRTNPIGSWTQYVGKVALYAGGDQPHILFVTDAYLTKDGTADITAVEATSDIASWTPLYQLEVDENKVTVVGVKKESGKRYIFTYTVDFASNTVTMNNYQLEMDDAKAYIFLYNPSNKAELKLLAVKKNGEYNSYDWSFTIEGYVIKNDGTITKTGTMTVEPIVIEEVTSSKAYAFLPYGVSPGAITASYEVAGSVKIQCSDVTDACTGKEPPLAFFIKGDEYKPVAFLPIALRFEGDGRPLYTFPIVIPNALFSGAEESLEIIDPPEKTVTGGVLVTTNEEGMSVESEQSSSSAQEEQTEASGSSQQTSPAPPTAEESTPQLLSASVPKLNAVVEEIKTNPAASASAAIALSGLLILLLSLR